MAERLTAIKCSVRDLVTGTFVVKEGVAPSYVDTVRGPVVRVNLLAAVVGKPGAGSLLLDDGTGTVEARSFEHTLFAALKPGDVALLVARPRQHEGTVYLVAEIAKRLQSPKWLELRKAELGLNAAETTKKQEQERKEEAPPQPSTTKKAPTPPADKNVEKSKEKKPAEPAPTSLDVILTLIRELDAGQGAAVEEVVWKGGPSAEGTLSTLMAEGEIFEIRPGRVKVLE